MLCLLAWLLPFLALAFWLPSRRRAPRQLVERDAQGVRQPRRRVEPRLADALLPVAQDALLPVGVLSRALSPGRRLPVSQAATAPGSTPSCAASWARVRPARPRARRSRAANVMAYL